MTLKEDKEKETMSRELLGKLFFDLAKNTFTTLVIGAIVIFFTAKGELDDMLLVSIIGLSLFFCFLIIGKKIIKNK